LQRIGGDFHRLPCNRHGIPPSIASCTLAFKGTARKTGLFSLVESCINAIEEFINIDYTISIGVNFME